MGYIENTVMKLPAEISDSRLLLLVKQSINNKEDLTAIKDSVSLKEIVAHVTIKYLGNPGLVLARKGSM